MREPFALSPVRWQPNPLTAITPENRRRTPLLQNGIADRQQSGADEDAKKADRQDPAHHAKEDEDQREIATSADEIGAEAALEDHEDKHIPSAEKERGHCGLLRNQP